MGKYSIKNIAFGIGLGMIISSILNISFNSKQLSVQDIKNEAIKHNLIVLSPEEFIKKQAGSSNETNIDNNSTNKLDINKKDNSNKVVISIKKGYNSEDVARILKESGLISDEKDFLSKLDKTRKSSKLQVGEYKLDSDINEEEIIRILTTYKK